MRKGLIVAACQLAIVSSLGAKLLVDRATRPRVWARTAPIDPNLPIRGRYVRLRLEAVPASGLQAEGAYMPVAISVKDSALTVSSDPDSHVYARVTRRRGALVADLIEPVAYFIPEHAVDPSRRQPGEELWVEVTVPRAGGPRPIRLGAMKDGVLTPIDVK